MAPSVAEQQIEALDQINAPPVDDSPEARLNAAYIHLMRGDFWQGLELYRSRPTVTRWDARLNTFCC
jgi:hypothetical protein